jgi:hypothetical protein
MALEQKKGGYVRVIYVSRQDAKRVKNRLEKNGSINKDYRMTPCTERDNKEGGEDESLIAIPILEDFTQELLEEVDFSLHGSGVQFCPYSTAYLGNHLLRKPQQGANSDSVDLSLTQRALWNVCRTLLSKTKTEDSNGRSPEDLLEQIRSFPPSVCPKRLEILGNDRILVIARQSLNPAVNGDFRCWLVEIVGNDQLDTILNDLWKELADLSNCPRIVRRGGVDPESRVRRSGHQMLWPPSQIDTPSDTETGTYDPVGFFPRMAVAEVPSHPVLTIAFAHNRPLVSRMDYGYGPRHTAVL